MIKSSLTPELVLKGNFPGSPQHCHEPCAWIHFSNTYNTPFFVFRLSNYINRVHSTGITCEAHISRYTVYIAIKGLTYFSL